MIIVCLFWSVIGLAADRPSSTFDPEQANKILDQVSIKLSTEELNVAHLEAAVATLDELREQSQQCIEESKKELAEVNRQLKAIGDLSQKTEEQTYLEKKKASLERLMSSCRLFDIRASEVIDAFTSTIKSQVTGKLLSRGPPIWESLAASPDILPTLAKQFSTATFMKNSGILALSSFSYWVMGVLISIGLLLGIITRYLLRDPLQAEASDKLSTQIKYDAYSVIHRFFPYLLPIFFVWGFLFVSEHSSDKSSYLYTFFLSMLLYTVFMMALRFFVSPPANQFALSRLPEKVAQKIVLRFHVLGWLSVFAMVVSVILADQDLPKQFYYLLESIFIVLVSINVISLIALINRLPKLLYLYKGIRLFISALLSALLVGIVTIELIGYHELAAHVLVGILLTILLFIVTWFVNMVVSYAIQSLREGGQPWHQRLNYYLGMRQNEQLTELIWIHAVSYIIIWSAFIGLILQIWGLSESDERLMYTLFVDGFSIANHKIVPAKIVLALLFFTGSVLLTRVARGYFLRNSNIIKDTSARFALSTIVGYVGFIFAVIISLLIAGVDFTGIAIIAGALSVGVGFGLQNIVNNFVSGLILLVERPIKLGDRILVGNTEGYVRKISIRSTRIRKQDRTDVLVPNSELIASQVINYMFMDKVYRVSVPVGVAYGSDTELVRKVLMDVALNCEHVVKEAPNAPKVLFRAFGASSLDFELWAVIENADRLNDAPSDLHFAIDKAFREHHIEIAFPHQDINIRSLPEGFKI